MLNFAIIGFGGLGKVHFKNVEAITKAAGDVKLVALCDVEKDAFEKFTATNISDTNETLDLSAYKLYNDAEELFENERLDFVITALPTYLHEKIAVMALNRKIHVFSEKPMAINLEQAQNMIDKAKENNVKLMIGQCLRFNPAYIALKKMIDEKIYGEVIRAEFSRLSQTPDWSWQNWMLDEERSGSAILDLHVHDVDFINWAFGKPHSVTSLSTGKKVSHESVMTLYNYGDGKLITAKADWGFPSCYPFTVSFSVRFEKAAIEYKGRKLMLYPEGSAASEIKLDDSNGYVNEVVEFISCIREDRVSQINPPEASMSSIAIAFAEKESADTNKTVTL
ncbi:MAG: Gfo/Idh/MocA family oxidoreductase [Clostridia bacterium]|nr:Gfo/Idh/MocA family oxidoreductase [Clostridia bacterium]